MKKAALVAGGLTAYAAGVGAVYVYMQAQKAPEGPLPSERERRGTFDSIAKHFDDDIDLHERVIGIRASREELVGRARGDVLEVAVGTGRNLQHYKRPRVASLTMTDFSDGMIEVARGKYAALPEAQRPVPGDPRTAPRDAPEPPAPPPPGSALFVPADSSRLPFPSDSFDTVVDTFGVCSFESPLEVLKELRRVCRAGGEVLLLEHGRSSWDLFNRYVLDPGLHRHVKKYGCYWNRDIETLVRESGLEVVSVEKRHLGTTVAVVARKRAEGRAARPQVRR
eukprot:tig00021489_g21671.t1